MVYWDFFKWAKDEQELATQTQLLLVRNEYYMNGTETQHDSLGFVELTTKPHNPGPYLDTHVKVRVFSFLAAIALNSHPTATRPGQLKHTFAQLGLQEPTTWLQEVNSTFGWLGRRQGFMGQIDSYQGNASLSYQGTVKGSTFWRGLRHAGAESY